jgi:hypothetical protein
MYNLEYETDLAYIIRYFYQLSYGYGNIEYVKYHVCIWFGIWIGFFFLSKRIFDLGVANIEFYKIDFDIIDLMEKWFECKLI